MRLVLIALLLLLAMSGAQRSKPREYGNVLPAQMPIAAPTNVQMNPNVAQNKKTAKSRKAKKTSLK